MKEKLELYFLHKETLIVEKIEGELITKNFPKEIKLKTNKYVPGRLKLKKDGRIMQTQTTNYFIFTELFKSDMLAELKWRKNQLKKTIKTVNVLLHFNYKRF